MIRVGRTLTAVVVIYSQPVLVGMDLRRQHPLMPLRLVGLTLDL
jgi:hypothetical protein